MGFSKYEFYNKLLGGVTLLRVTPGVTWTQLIAWWCTKIVSELIVHTHANGYTWRTKEKNQSKGTGSVLAKDPPKVKLVMEESLRTQ